MITFLKVGVARNGMASQSPSTSVVYIFYPESKFAVLSPNPSFPHLEMSGKPNGIRLEELPVLLWAHENKVLTWLERTVNRDV